jgi:hypothetical protein
MAHLAEDPNDPDPDDTPLSAHQIRSKLAVSFCSTKLRPAACVSTGYKECKQVDKLEFDKKFFPAINELRGLDGQAGFVGKRVCWQHKRCSNFILCSPK